MLGLVIHHQPKLKYHKYLQSNHTRVLNGKKNCIAILTILKQRSP